MVSASRATTTSPVEQATVSGAGVAWTLAARQNDYGTAEVWTARATTALTNATVQAAFAQPSAGGQMTVLALSGAGGIGSTAVSTVNYQTYSGTLALTPTASGSWILASGR